MDKENRWGMLKRFPIKYVRDYIKKRLQSS